jgi:6-phospho-beta-glucosidase
MKVAVLGGGGFRTPHTLRALLEAAARLKVTDVVLHDVQASRLERITPIFVGLLEESGAPAPFVLRATTDLADALRGVDFVLCAIRVGGLEARRIDERVPLAEGIVGQETVGPGGICLILRSTSVVEGIAQSIAQQAPRAWVINFTNPVGAMTHVMQAVLGERAIGVCDTPSSLCARVAAVLDCAASELRFDYFGINHLGWLRSVHDGSGRDRLPDLLADDARLSQLEESRLFGVDQLRSLGMLPSEYLSYYLYPERVIQSATRGEPTRAEVLLAQQRAFDCTLMDRPVDALRVWRRVSKDRNRSYMQEMLAAPGSDFAAGVSDEGYAGVAVALIEALAGISPRELILNAANRSRFGFLADDAVVESACQVDSAGVRPRAIAEVPLACRELLERVHRSEELAVSAARSHSRRVAVEALATNPLVGSVPTAERLLDGYLREHVGLSEQLA